MNNIVQMPAKRKKNLKTLYDLINGNIDEDDIEYNPDDDVDEDYLELIDRAVDTGIALKISKLHLTGNDEGAKVIAKKFISLENPDIDKETLDTYASQMVKDYRDFAWED